MGVIYSQRFSQSVTLRSMVFHTRRVFGVRALAPLVACLAGLVATCAFTNNPHNPREPREYHHPQHKRLSPQMHRDLHEKFIETAARGNPHLLSDIRREDNIDINFRSTQGTLQTALMSAVLAGNHPNVEYLLHAGADPQIREKSGLLPIHGIALQGHAELVGIFHAHNVPLDTVHSDGYSPLHHCIWKTTPKHVATLGALIAKGADINVKGPGGTTPLMSAVERSNWPAVQLLLSHKDVLNINEVNAVGLTAVHLAATNAGREPGKRIMEALIFAGGNLDLVMPNSDGQTARKLLQIMEVHIPGIPGLDGREYHHIEPGEQPQRSEL